MTDLSALRKLAADILARHEKLRGPFAKPLHEAQAELGFAEASYKAAPTLAKAVEAMAAVVEAAIEVRAISCAKDTKSFNEVARIEGRFDAALSTLTEVLKP